MQYLILSVTAGEGHNSTARAIQNEVQLLGADCTILDTFDYVSPDLARLISEGYLLVTEKAKNAYRIGYRMAEMRHPRYDPLKLANLAMADDLADFIHADTYDAVLFTHPFSGMLLDVMKERRIIQNRTVGILTDFTFHPYWEDCIRNDYVVTPDPLLLPQARRKGFRDEQILPFGIPISPAFAERVPREEARRQLGLAPDKPTFLLMGGSMGYGHMGDLVERMDAQIPQDFQLLVVCGNNAESKEEIDAIAAHARHPLFVYGFVRTIPLFMDAADCLISKPGGLTTSECLAKGLPMIIVNPIPGQEERNAEFLLNAGCAVRMSKTCPIEECMHHLLSSDVRLDAMRQCISKIGKPHAAADLARFLSDLSHTPMIVEEPPAAPDFAAHPVYIDENGYIIR